MNNSDLNFISKKLKSIGEALTLLKEEQDFCLKKSVNDMKNQFWLRSLFRSVFSELEASCYFFKYNSLQFNDYRNLDKITYAERAIIDEVNYSINNNGNTRTYSSFNSIDLNFRFSVKIFVKIFDLDYKLDLKNCEGWDALKKSIKVRNRLTHPKHTDDLFITENERVDLGKAKLWFSSVFDELVELVEYKIELENDY